VSVQAGIWNFDGSSVDSKLLADFSESLKQRGPDGESCYVGGSVALLYRPFHTTAESRREKQPYISRRGFFLTWDGRLDNRDELIPELRGELEADPTDIAIVAAAFDRWKTDCFRRILGDWAVSVYRPEQRELIFAVDYMAVRHIFYHLRQDRVWWSTDLTPLVLLSGGKFHVEDDYIAGYLANDPDAHLTPYREIRQTSPGHFVRITKDGRVSVHRFWWFTSKSKIRYETDADYEEHFRHLFRQSVRRRLRSDSPVLAELSGGLDSSSIVCMADDILEHEPELTQCLDTLSYYDKTEPHGDDWIYFRKIEERRGRVGAHIDASKYGESASFDYAEFTPVPGNLGAGRQIEAERAIVLREGGHRAVLSGIGGDEFMGGNPDPCALLADLIAQFKVARLAKELVAWSLIKRKPVIQLLWQAIVQLLPTSLVQYIAKEAKIEPWIEGDFARRTRLASRQLDVNDHFDMWLPSRRAYVAGVFLMANRMAASTPRIHEEMRYPYLDRDLIQFILSVPASQLLRPGERRSLMRRSLVGVVPHEILSRRTKQAGARTPVIALGKNWEELQAVFDSPLSTSLGYIKRNEMLNTMHAARDGKTVHIPRLLSTVALEFWLRDLSSRGLLYGPTVSLPVLKNMPLNANA